LSIPLAISSLRPRPPCPLSSSLFPYTTLFRSQPMVILDGAHNVAGMDAFLQTVTHEAIGHKKHLVFAGFQDKELLKMIHQCLPHFDTVIWTSFDHSRAASHEAIMNALTTEQKIGRASCRARV